jgi:hypothetical protein
MFLLSAVEDWNSFWRGNPCAFVICSFVIDELWVTSFKDIIFDLISGDLRTGCSIIAMPPCRFSLCKILLFYHFSLQYCSSYLLSPAEVRWIISIVFNMPSTPRAMHLFASTKAATERCQVRLLSKEHAHQLWEAYIE